MFISNLKSGGGKKRSKVASKAMTHNQESDSANNCDLMDGCFRFLGV